MTKQIGPIDAGGSERVRDNEGNLLNNLLNPVAETGDQDQQEESEMAKRGRRDGPGAASGVPNPTSLLDLKSPKKEDDAGVALKAWADAELAPYLKIADENRAEILLVRAEEQVFLETLRGFNEAQFEIIYENVNRMPDYKAREATRDRVHRLKRVVQTLNSTLSDEPSILAQKIRNLTIEQVKACPPDGKGHVGLNEWKEDWALQMTPTRTREEFKRLKAEIESVKSQIEKRLLVPRRKSPDEQDFGFQVDRTVPPKPRQVGFDVFGYDRPEE